MALFPDWNSQISSSFHLSLFAIFMQLLDFPLLRFSFKLDSFEHASMFVSPPCHICKSYSFRMDISCFWYLFWGRWYFCSLCFWPRAFPSAFSLHWPCWTSRHYHWLLQLIVFVSLLAVLAPNRFHTALVLTIQLYFKDVGSRACYGFLQRARRGWRVSSASHLVAEENQEEDDVSVNIEGNSDGHHHARPRTREREHPSSAVSNRLNMSTAAANQMRDIYLLSLIRFFHFFSLSN